MRANGNGKTLSFRSGTALIASVLIGLWSGGCEEQFMPKEELEAIAAVKRQILQDPSRVNALSETGLAPLHEAVINGRVSLISWLLDHGATPNVRDRRGRSPLHHAVIADHTPNRSIMKTLLDRGAAVDAADDYGQTPLHDAAEFANVSAIRVLLSRGANPNAQAQRGEAPLHYAARHPVNVKPKDYKLAIHLLVASGAQVDIQDRFGRAPIHLASMFGNTEVVEALLSDGADINLKTNHGYGSTPLHLAASMGHGALAEVLLDKGAEINAMNRDGLTPLRVALERPAMHYRADGSAPVDTAKVVEVLRRRGAAER